jgi:hypothetical protein
MSRSYLRPLIVAALLNLSFSSFSQAAEYRARERTLRTDLLRAAIEFLVKHGCSIDPRVCAPSPPKHGCTIDPHGGCQPSDATSPTETEHGCGLDPNGACNGG